MKTTQAARKMTLPTRLMMLPLSTLEAMKKPAHTRKRIQPSRWNFLSRFLSSEDIVVSPHNPVIMKGITHSWLCNSKFRAGVTRIDTGKMLVKYISLNYYKQLKNNLTPEGFMGYGLFRKEVLLWLI